jgi:hypothetical protein
VFHKVYKLNQVLLITKEFYSLYESCSWRFVKHFLCGSPSFFNPNATIICTPWSCNLRKYWTLHYILQKFYVHQHSHWKLKAGILLWPKYIPFVKRDVITIKTYAESNAIWSQTPTSSRMSCYFTAQNAPRSTVIDMNSDGNKMVRGKQAGFIKK